jgi:hypothetical protein
MEMQRRVELISSPAREGSWQSVGLIASSVLAGVSTDSVVSFEAVSGERRAVNVVEPDRGQIVQGASSDRVGKCIC